MENQQKILFFDIDGTLLTPPPFTVPESTKLALQKTQEQGHLIFINSGRTFEVIPAQIKELGFDGYVCGCGTQIYMHGKLLHSFSLPHSLCCEIIETLRRCRIPCVFECSDRILYDGKAPLHALVKFLRQSILVEDVTLFTGERAQTFCFDKFFLQVQADSDEEAFRHFCEENDLVIFDHGKGAWEITHRSHSKATGIQFLLAHLNLPRENSFAFGDSNNDLPMLQYAANSIAMGNSMPSILPYCTYQTTDICDNGIYNALKHFGLF